VSYVGLATNLENGSRTESTQDPLYWSREVRIEIS
jgi:hypothetical protein